MKEDYTNTPSFYNSEEYFNKYLGNTSYYLGLQDVVDRIIGIIKPKTVLELGAALGTTSLMLARRHPETDFQGSDLRADVVELANEAASQFDNAHFFAEDMCETAKKSLERYDLIFLLYAFHHILDPLEKKVTFLEDCYRNMHPGAYLLILETFLPEDIEDIEGEQGILDLWNLRSQEGYASTFWAALQNLDDDGLDFAKRVASTSCKEEAEAGNHVFHREDEYLVKFSWLKRKAEESGFQVVIAEPVNCLYEEAILLRK